LLFALSFLFRPLRPNGRVKLPIGSAVSEATSRLVLPIGQLQRVLDETAAGLWGLLPPLPAFGLRLARSSALLLPPLALAPPP